VLEAVKRKLGIDVGETTDDYYYDEGWQAVEVRLGGDPDPLDQYVWDVRYVDAPVVRFHDSNTDDDYLDTGDNVLYYTTDANWNVTALVDAETGEVVERYMYDPYGKATVLNGANGTDPDVNGTTVLEWDPDADGLSDVANDVLFAGYRFDAETGLYATDTRVYHPTLGAWLGRDAGYIDTTNLYQYCRSNPATLNDPMGTCAALPIVIILEGAEGLEIIDGVIIIFDTVLLKYIMDMIPTPDGTGHNTSDPGQAGPGGGGKWIKMVIFSLCVMGGGYMSFLVTQRKTPTPSEVPSEPREPSPPPDIVCEPTPPRGKEGPPRLGPQPWEPGGRKPKAPVPARPVVPDPRPTYPRGPDWCPDRCDCPEHRDLPKRWDID
jgi:RHS repeat-associated protein